jgi:hypothetical protein
MRRLAQPQVVTHAAIAAALSAALTLPRMMLWEKRVFPLWYLEAIVFFGGFVLWAFVFAWHTEYTRRPVFTLKINSLVFALATLAGIASALSLHYLFDPTLRIINPAEYPTDFDHWLASTLFTLAFAQLLLVFAPFAWSMRLFRNENVAIGITVTFAAVVWWLKVQSSPHSLPSILFAELLMTRIIQSTLGMWFYLRGGIVLIWWLGFLVEARHLLSLQGM